MEITPGVHVFPQTIDRNGDTNTIYPAAVETRKGLLLLDIGYPGLNDQIEFNLSEGGFDWRDIWGALITHQDRDHAGGLPEVNERTDVFVCAHERCAPYVDGRNDLIKSSKRDRYAPVPVDFTLRDGNIFYTSAGPMEVLFTPGHTPGHVSMYFPDRSLLIAADALTSDGRRLNGPSEQHTADMQAALKSLNPLAQRDIDRTVCYHGGLVEEGTERIAQLSRSL